MIAKSPNLKKKKRGVVKYLTIELSVSYATHLFRGTPALDPWIPCFQIPLNSPLPFFPNSVPTHLTQSYFGGGTDFLGSQPQGQLAALLTVPSRHCSPETDKDLFFTGGDA